MVVYLATDLNDDPLKADADEFLQLEKIPVKTAVAMALTGQIPDAKSLAALFLARPKIEKYL
jgi:hypothetical protein